MDVAPLGAPQMKTAGTPVFQRSGRSVRQRDLHPAARVDQARRAFSSSLVTTQLLVFEMGRVSAISTRAPILYSPFSSWAWYLRERPTILPYSSWMTRRSTSTVMVLERLSLTTRPTRVRVFVCGLAAVVVVS